MVASWLSLVSTEGVAMTLVSVSLRMARNMAAKLMPLLATRPRATVVPFSSAELMLVGLTTALARSTRLAPPTGVRKVAPGMVVPLLSDQVAQFTPSSEDLARFTSTMIASTSTSARRMSSLAMMSLIWRRTFGGAVITRALLAGSDQIWEFLLSCWAGVAAPAAPPVAAAATPVI